MKLMSDLVASMPALDLGDLSDLDLRGPLPRCQATDTLALRLAAFMAWPDNETRHGDLAPDIFFRSAGIMFGLARHFQNFAITYKAADEVARSWTPIPSWRCSRPVFYPWRPPECGFSPGGCCKRSAAIGREIEGRINGAELDQLMSSNGPTFWPMSVLGIAPFPVGSSDRISAITGWLRSIVRRKSPRA